MNILVAGGGTGGHVYPALAVIEELRRRFSNIRIGYVGTARGLESEVMRREPGVEFYEIEAAGIERNISLKKIGEIRKNASGVCKAAQVLLEFDPDLIFGTGGYVSFAPLLWGTIFKIPTLIHEQNRVPGLVNRLLAPRVDAVMTSYPGFPVRSKRLVQTGLPLRSSFNSIRNRFQPEDAKSSLNLDPDKKLVLVAGGTHGAQMIHNQILSGSEALERANAELVILAGRDAKRLRKTLTGPDANIKVLGHTQKIGTWMRAADLMVCRAGGSTLAEMLALGVPSIVIPWAGAVGNHQTHNASWLTENEACRVIEESECTKGVLIDEITRLLDDDATLNAMREKQQEISKPDATQLVVEEVSHHLQQEQHVPLYRHWRRWNERLGVALTRTGSFRQRFGL